MDRRTCRLVGLGRAGALDGLAGRYAGRAGGLDGPAGLAGRRAGGRAEPMGLVGRWLVVGVSGLFGGGSVLCPG